MSTSALDLETQEFPWWIPLLQGIASVVFGLLLLFVREEFISLIVILLGLYWLIGGLFNIISIFIDSSAWGWKLFIGVLGILAGIIVIQHPLWGSFVLPALAAVLLGIQGLIRCGQPGICLQRWRLGRRHSGCDKHPAGFTAAV